MKSSRKNFSEKKRNFIIKELIYKYGLRCWYCGISLKNETIYLDHIKSFSNGGKDDIENLALSCKFCNAHKFYFPTEEFLEYLAYIRTGNFECLILKEYKNKIEPTIYDILSKSFY